WQWGRDTGGRIGTSVWKNAFDANDSGVGGQSWEEPYRVLLGGAWISVAVCGSRGSEWANSPLCLYSNYSSRGIAEPKN
ncbi:MAG: hypothetical protein ACUZ8H_07055, partial [Candidatus Anammoxibacter sp.]